VSSYSERLSHLVERSALLDRLMADFVKEADQLVTYRAALKIAYLERTAHEAENDDVFDDADEVRAHEIVASLSTGGA
jgi:hypothetical protein